MRALVRAALYATADVRGKDLKGLVVSLIVGKFLEKWKEPGSGMGFRHG